MPPERHLFYRMIEDWRIIETEDGSHSLFKPSLNETYHSTRGAKEESLHVFIRNGFDKAVEAFPNVPIHILEVGMGTGLNVWLTALLAGPVIHYTSLEPFPLPKEIWAQLNYPQSEKEKVLFQAIHEAAWEEPIALSTSFSLLKKQCTLETFEGEASSIHLIYFDAFAPNKQAEVWSIENLEKLYTLLVPGGGLSTYCAQGQFRRNLKSAGFEVHILAGPPGKKEMTYAQKRNEYVY
jgi:tRNA U34 5-methylaminomethyl-2-thiouridine-forming methyltransferase MnmC